MRLTTLVARPNVILLLVLMRIIETVSIAIIVVQVSHNVWFVCIMIVGGGG